MTNAPRPWSASAPAPAIGWAIPSTVKLVEAAPVTGGLRFELAEGGAKPARPQRPAQPGKARNAKAKRRFKPKKR